MRHLQLCNRVWRSCGVTIRGIGKVLPELSDTRAREGDFADVSALVTQTAAPSPPGE